jgi:hypothetical protein
MTNMTHIVILLCLSLLWVGSPGCTTVAPVASGSDRMGELERRIETVIGEARAESIDQCRTIAFGSKPCGGPWRYLVYSISQTDSAELEKLVSEYNALQDADNRRRGLVSDCALAAPPTVDLIDGRCIAKGASLGNVIVE